MTRLAKYLFFAAALNAGVCSADNQLRMNYVLQNGGYISSPNGRYTLIMQTDGSLVMYRSDGSVRYSMAKYGTYAIMQTDGNFVQYAGGNANTGGGTAIWATNTQCSDCWLEITDGGDLEIGWHNYNKTYGYVQWSIGYDTEAPATWDAYRYPMSQAIPASSAPAAYPTGDDQPYYRTY